MSKRKELEYPPLFETIQRSDAAGTWTEHTTALDQATAMTLVPDKLHRPARAIVMHRDHTVRVPFHPDVQRQNFVAPPNRLPRGKGECMAYLYAHPVYGGGHDRETGFAQHVRWRALDSLFDTFSVLQDVRNHEELEELKEATMQYVDNMAGEGMLFEVENRFEQFAAEHPGWCIGWLGRGGGYWVLMPNYQKRDQMPGSEFYRQLHQSELNAFTSEELQKVAETVYHFDEYCLDAVMDVIAEGFHNHWPDRHLAAMQFAH